MRVERACRAGLKFGFKRVWVGGNEQKISTGAGFYVVRTKSTLQKYQAMQFNTLPTDSFTGSNFCPFVFTIFWWQLTCQIWKD